MNTKTILRLLLGICLMGSAVQAQNCTTPVTTINENFNTIAHNSIPVCWTRHTPSLPNVFNGVSNTNQRYHFYWMDSNATPDQLSPQHFIAVMPLCTVNGIVTFKLNRPNLTSVWQWPVEVGTMSDPNNPSTFVPLYAFYSTSNTQVTYTADLTNYVGSNQHIAFRSFMGEGNTFHIDDITW